MLLLLVGSLVPLPAKATQTETGLPWSIHSILDSPLVIVDESFIQPIYVPTPTKPPPTPKPPVRVYNTTTATIVDTDGIGNGWCTDLVWSYGHTQYRGNAYEWKRYINTASPSFGDIIVLNEGPIGHVAVIEGITSKSIDILEQNYKGKYVVSTRTIPRNYGLTVGFIHPPVASVSQEVLLR